MLNSPFLRVAGAGLDALDALRRELALANYPYLPSVRADLLMRIGRLNEACDEFERALTLTQNAREKEC